MKIASNAIQNHAKSILESQEIHFLRKLIFATLPLPTPCFCNPRHPNSHSKIIRTNSLVIDMTKYRFLVQKYSKAPKMVPLNQQEIDKIQAWTSQGPSVCPPMSQDCLRINLRSGCKNARHPASRSQRASTHFSRGI